jgi:hypothetical protein
MMNSEWIAAPGKDWSSRELAEPGEPKTSIVQRCSRIVFADLCATSAPGMDTNRSQQDAA